MSENAHVDQPEKSPIELAIDIFMSPRTAFEHIVQKPTWVVPIVLVIVVGCIWAVLTAPLMMDFQYEMMSSIEKFPAAQLEEMANNENNYAWVTPIIATPIIFLIITGVYLLTGNFIFGGQATFKQVWSVVCWSWVINIVGSSIMFGSMLGLGEFGSATSLAFIFGIEKYSLAFFIFNQIDLLVLWQVAVAGIGLSVLYNFSQVKGISITIFWWLLFVISMAGLSRLPFIMMGDGA